MDYETTYSDDALRYRYNIVPFKNRKNIKFLFKEVSLAGTYYHLGAMFGFCLDEEEDYSHAFFNPNNPYDKNAVQLTTNGGELLGYVPKEIAARLAFVEKQNLFIRPQFKGYYNHGLSGDKAIFIFDILQVEDVSLLSPEEFLTIVPIKQIKKATFAENALATTKAGGIYLLKKAYEITLKALLILVGICLGLGLLSWFIQWLYGAG